VHQLPKLSCHSQERRAEYASVLYSRGEYSHHLVFPIYHQPYIFGDCSQVVSVEQVEDATDIAAKKEFEEFEKKLSKEDPK
jgi:hypothetical protein